MRASNASESSAESAHSHGASVYGTVGYSLEHKLAAIAHDRAVLHLLRDLADKGLREGDRVRNRVSGVEGSLVVERTAPSPRVLVQPDRAAGSPVPVADLSGWERR